MKKIFLIIILQISLFSFSYDNLLLKAQAKIYPKLLFLTKNLKEKTIKNNIIFTIVYHPSDLQKIQLLKQYIKHIYPKLGKYNFIVVLKEFREINENDFSTAYYVLKGDVNSIKKIAYLAQKKHTILFSYDLESLKYGALISLHIEEEPIIYFNNSVHNLYNIDFISMFYQIVRLKDD